MCGSLCFGMKSGSELQNSTYKYTDLDVNETVIRDTRRHTLYSAVGTFSEELKTFQLCPPVALLPLVSCRMVSAII